MNHSSHDKPFIISGALFVASFVLEGYMAMYALPIPQAELLEWVSWILSAGGVIVFFSALVNHKKGK